MRKDVGLGQYSKRELAMLLAKAAELQLENDLGESGSYTLFEAMQIAVEVGIEPECVRMAADLHAGGNVLGGRGSPPVLIEREVVLRDVAESLSQDVKFIVESVLRLGEPSFTSSPPTWRWNDPMRLSVVMSSAPNGLYLRLRSDRRVLRNAIYFMSASTAGVLGSLVSDFAGWSLPWHALAVIGGVGLGLALGRVLWTVLGRELPQQIAALMHRIKALTPQGCQLVDQSGTESSGAEVTER